MINSSSNILRPWLYDNMNCSTFYKHWLNCFRFNPSLVRTACLILVYKYNDEIFIIKKCMAEEQLLSWSYRNYHHMEGNGF